MNFKIESLLTVAASALLVGTLVTGCKDISYPDPQPTTAAPNTSARVLFANATADATALTAYLENLPVGTVLALGQATNYVTVPFLGSLQLRVKGAGGTLGTNDVTNKSTVAANSAYTVFVTDSINRPVVRNAANIITDAGGARLLFVTDNLSTTLTSGANVRVMNLSPDAAVSGATSVTVVSVRLSVPSSSTALPTPVGSFNNRAYRTISAAFSNIPANTYKVDVFSGASLPSSTTVTPLTSTTVTLDNTKFYTLYTQGVGRKRTLSVGRIQHN